MAELSVYLHINSWWDTTVHIPYEVALDQATGQTRVTFGWAYMSYSGAGGASTNGSVGITVTPTDNTGAAVSCSMSWSGTTKINGQSYGGTPSPSVLYVQHSLTTGEKSVRVSATVRIGVHAEPSNPSWWYEPADSASQVTTSGSYAPQGLSIRPDVLTAGEATTLDVSYGSDYSFTAVFTANGTELARHSWSGASTSFTCPGSWFEAAGQITPGDLAVDVTVTGAPQALTGSLALRPGGDMAPHCAPLQASPVQPETAAEFNVFIAGISSAELSLEAAGKYGAAIQSVVLSVGGESRTMAYNAQSGRYEVLIGPLTRNETLTATVTDSRGLSGSVSITVPVQGYSAPSLTVGELYRCDALGAETNGGAYIRIRASATITAIEGNSIERFTAACGGTSAALRSGELSGAICGPLESDRSYVLTVTLQDAVSTPIVRQFLIESARRDLVLIHSGDGAHLGVGKAPEQQTGSTIELPSGGKLVIHTLRLGDGSFVLSSALYGESLPAAPEEGQLFVQLTEDGARLRLYADGTWR